MSETALDAALKLAAEKTNAGWAEPLKLADADFSQQSVPVAWHNTNVISFRSPDNGVILEIHPDGRLVRGEAFATGDEASVAMFECMSKCLPSFLSQLRMRAETAEHAFRLLHDKAAEEDGYEALGIAQTARELPWDC